MNDSSINNESRDNRRGRTLKTGKVWFNNFQSVMDCQVRDLSDTGAKVRFEAPFPCPDKVALYFPLDEYEGHLRMCETKWVRDREAGLNFTSEAKLTRFEELSKQMLV